MDIPFKKKKKGRRHYSTSFFMIIIFQKDLFGHRRQEHHSVYSDLFTRFFCFVGILSKKQQTSFFLKSALSIAVYR